MTRNRSWMAAGVLGAMALGLFGAKGKGWAYDAADPSRPAPGRLKYADVRAFLRGLATQHRDNVKLFTLGMSDSGQPIEGIVIGSGPVHNLVVATHHGNEYGSTEVALGFAASLASSPIQGQTVSVIPVLNLSGYDSRNRYEVSGGAIHDPNRDYPGPCGTEGPFKLKSTAALAAYVEKEGIVASATLHTYHPAVLYPWGMSTHDLVTEYPELFKQLGVAATVESKYTVGNSAEVIYPADGTFEDYAFWKLGIWSMLFEMGRTHYPNDPSVEELVRVNVPGLRRMLETAPRVRAERHAFRGKCDLRLRSRDRHDE